MTTSPQNSRNRSNLTELELEVQQSLAVIKNLPWMGINKRTMRKSFQKGSVTGMEGAFGVTGDWSGDSRVF